MEGSISHKNFDGMLYENSQLVQLSNINEQLINKNNILKQQNLIKDSEISRLNMEKTYYAQQKNTSHGHNELLIKDAEKNIRKEFQDKLQVAADDIDYRLEDYKQKLGNYEKKDQILTQKNKELSNM